MKLLHLALRNIAKKWTVPGHDWHDFMHKNSPLLACTATPAARMSHSIQCVALAWLKKYLILNVRLRDFKCPTTGGFNAYTDRTHSYSI